MSTLLNRVSRLKQLEVSFIHMGMFFELGENFETVLGRFREKQEKRLNNFEEFLVFFYDAFEESDNSSNVCLHCCGIMFPCCFRKSEFYQLVERLKSTHIQRLTKDDMLADFQVLQAGVASASRMLERANQVASSEVGEERALINYQTMDSSAGTRSRNPRRPQPVELAVMGSGNSEETPLLEHAV